MRKIDKFEKINEERFKRVIGVKRATFEVMVKEYKKVEEERKKGHKIGGRKPKLCEEDRVLFMLEYYREYRTLYHMGIDYGISRKRYNLRVNLICGLINFDRGMMVL